MPHFKYKAASVTGEVIEGEMEAATQEAVIRRLQAQGHVPIRAVEAAVGAGGSGRGTWLRLELGRRGISSRDITVFTVELSTLLKAGLPLDRALDVLENLGEIGPLQPVIKQIHDAVRGGKYLSAAMAEHPRAFSDFYVNLVRAGEASGALDTTLERLSEFLERSRELREAVISALVYPIILVLVAVLCLGVVLGVVVPRLTQMFADAGHELPWFTQLTVALGQFVQGYWWAIVAVGALLVMAVRQDYASSAGRLRWDGWILKVPLLGSLVEKLEAARFTRTLGTMLSGGVSLLKSISIAKEVVGNTVIVKGMDRLAGRVREGEGLARPLLDSDVLPSLAVQLLKVGEETGQLESMLVKIADIYDRDVQTAIKRLVAILGPVMILGLALLVALVMVSVIVPMLSINDLAF
ncbi:MAG: type II secretion system F family protein [Gammaproteobacteria bacterium]|nr:type II secretion system F family protein [Gammaproteobacteria bacterium]